MVDQRSALVKPATLDVSFWDIAWKSAYHLIASVSSGDIQDA